MPPIFSENGDDVKAGRDGRDGRVPGMWTDTTLEGKIDTLLGKYLALTPIFRLVVSAWVKASWLTEFWDQFPHLAITSPEPRCGKTRLLELLKLICRNPLLLANTTAPAVFRKIAVDRRNPPTLLLDEAQSLSSYRSESSQMVREILCAGIGKSAVVSRCVGQDHVPTDFQIYCAKVIALIGEPDRVLADRCLHIRMGRKKESDNVERWRLRIVEQEGAALKAELETWRSRAATCLAVSRIYDTVQPFSIANDRMAELLTPLQTVLMLEPGESWPTNDPLSLLNQYALRAQVLSREQEMQSPGVQLLAACREILVRWATTTRIPLYHLFCPTETVISALVARQEEPWATWSRGRSITAEALARLLKDYGIKPGHDKTRTMRGYCAADFKDAWESYLPPLETPSNPSSPSREGGRP
jgi:hypothetical protein